MKSILPAVCVSFMAISLLGCGGGGGGDDDSPPTYRPKTLDGIFLTLDSNVNFEFRRSVGTAPALFSGDIETGTFFYSQGGVQIRQYPNQQGDNSDARWPDAINNATYTYQAINESTALITLSGIGVNDLVTTGRFNANNGSFAYFFNNDSSFNDNYNVEIDITFNNNNNQFVTVNTTTTRIPGSAEPNYDIMRIPAEISLVAGGTVPVNYNPVIVPESRLAPESLNNTLIQFTNGIPNPLFDFTIDFVSDATQTAAGNSTEVGQGFLRVAGAPVVNAINYTWARLDGTETGTLVITGSNTTYDGSYTINFSGTDNGSYVGSIDALTLDASEVTGTFTIPGAP